MPVLAGLLRNFLLWLIGFFGKYVAKRAANALALTAFLLSAWGVFYAAVVSMITGIAYHLPDNFRIVMSWFYPTNFDAILTGYFAVQLAYHTYAWVKETIKVNEFFL